MYKSKLQELCQRRSWELPEYTTVKDGPDHMPRFTAAVTVHGQVFETPALCKSSKDAQNTAARIAFAHFNAPPPTLEVNHSPETASDPAAANSQSQGVSSDVPVPSHTVPPIVLQPEVQPVVKTPPLLPLSPLPSSLPMPPLGLLETKKANIKPANLEVPLQNCKDTTQTSMVYRIAVGSHNEQHKDGDDTQQFHTNTLHMYKNQLQQFAQKKNFGLPKYTTEADGPPHARRYKSSVSLNGKSYETGEFFPTMKEAEQAVAKVACQMLSVDVIQEDGGLYKSLLQALAQKRGLLPPSYATVKLGLSHRPLFSSIVELGGHEYRGAESKTKKQAEMNAAKAAYCALMESLPSTEYSSISSVSECDVADSVSQNIQPSEIIKKRQDSTVEEAPLQPKRAKSSAENMCAYYAHLPGESHSNSLSDDSTSHPQTLNVQSIEEQPSFGSKILVYPRKSGLPKPEHASVLPFSDDKWVAYKVRQHREPGAQL
ncbi:HLA class II histocompatibility antigen, DR beta 4 chain [Orobanche gracilis]